jgi:16S rRNA (guanine527-N7)-methyltransferase
VNQETELAAGLEQLGLRLTNDQWADIETYLKMLQKWQASINLTAVHHRHDLLRLHFFEAFWAAETFLEPSLVLVDIGSGAGFPGMAMKLFRPETRITLIEKNLKKAMFLKTLARELCLDAAVVAKPAESFGNWQAVDCAMSRALRPSKDLLQTLQDNNVHFLHFRGARKEESFDSWKLTAEQRFPLSENRWVSLYVPIVSRETSVDR